MRGLARRRLYGLLEIRGGLRPQLRRTRRADCRALRVRGRAIAALIGRPGWLFAARLVLAALAVRCLAIRTAAAAAAAATAAGAWAIPSARLPLLTLLTLLNRLVAPVSLPTLIAPHVGTLA